MALGSGIISFSVGGIDTASGCIPLYTKGPIVAPGDINLHLEGGSFVSNEEDINLFVDGSTSGSNYIFNSINMFMPAEPMDVNINMFVQGVGQTGSASGSMNLFVGGLVSKSSSNIDLVVAAATGSGIYKFDTLDLFIEGEGTLAGSVPIDASINMHLEVSPGSNAQINLVLPNVISSGNNNLPLNIFGVSGIINDNFNLFIRGAASLNANIDLFTRGFDA